MESRQVIAERIKFLKENLESLEHYLPETYSYILEELDIQHRKLMEHKINTFYQEVK
jgi:hypothetical protein